jgi:DNA-binding transcriptional regulator YiaG
MTDTAEDTVLTKAERDAKRKKDFSQSYWKRKHLTHDLIIEEKQLRMDYFDIEKRKKVLGLVTNALINIAENDVLDKKDKSLLYSGFSEEDKELLKSVRYKPINGLYKTTTDHPIVKKDIIVLKKDGGFDTRKVNKEKRPSKLFDYFLDCKETSTKKRLENVESAQQQVNMKMEQFASALATMQEKVQALEFAGFKDKINNLYKLSLEYPFASQQELADMIGKSRKTVNLWLKEIDMFHGKLKTS